MQFDGVLGQPDNTEDLIKLVDPRLGDNYPVDSVRKVRNLLRVNPLNVCFLWFQHGSTNICSLFGLADGTTSQSLYTRQSSTPSKYEIYCGCANDTFFNYRRVGCWFLLWKSKSCESNVRKIGWYEINCFVFTIIRFGLIVCKMDVAFRNLYMDSLERVESLTILW